MMMNDCTI
jgi:hypothetical protein